ncbi:MAG TPA: thiamine phosphate synthase [Terriglobales bacterium]
MLLYYITDRLSLANDETQRRQRLLQKIAEAAHLGVDFIQLREKNLSGKQLESLAIDAMRAIQENSTGTPSRTKLLINSRADVALACSANGVHLRSGDIPPRTVHEIYSRSASAEVNPIVSVSCHSAQEVLHASAQGADLALFAPVFGKFTREKNGTSQPAAGLNALQEACQQKIPVLALGGITLEKAHDCIKAGAVGIAAIRLFQENDLAEVVGKLRGL